MKSILTPFLGLFLCSASFGQTITSVTTTPATVKACEMMVFHVAGTAPPGMSFTFLNYSATGNMISLVIEASGPGSGSSPFNNPVNGGPYAQGAYTLSVSLQYNGTITSTWTGSLTVQAPDLPDVGEENVITVCPNAAPFALLSQLGGTPDAGGIWWDAQLATVTDGMFVPGVSPEGTYQYHFEVLQPCEDPYQYLTILYAPNTTAGSSSAVTLCTAPEAPPVDLFGQLGGTPDMGGAWTFGEDAVPGIFMPGTSAPGIYTYTVAGIAPCPNATATVTVEGGAPSNAGTGESAWYCYDENLADLASHISGGANTGIWYGPDGSGIGYYSQPVDVATYGAGEYMYVVITDPCPADTALVAVTLLGPPCTVGISAPEPREGAMVLTPNPAHGHVWLEAAPGGCACTAVVKSVGGQVVLRQALKDAGSGARHLLDISQLQPGVYTVELTGGAAAPVRRLVVQ